MAYNIDEMCHGVPKPPFTYTEENNDKVVILNEDLGSAFEGTGPGNPDGFKENPPSSFRRK